jgi:hypothetical protein
MTNSNNVYGPDPENRQEVPAELSKIELDALLALPKSTETPKWSDPGAARVEVTTEDFRHRHMIPLSAVQKAAARRVQYNRPKDQSFDAQAHEHDNTHFNRQEH